MVRQGQAQRRGLMDCFDLCTQVSESASEQGPLPQVGQPKSSMVKVLVQIP